MYRVVSMTLANTIIKKSVITFFPQRLKLYINQIFCRIFAIFAMWWTSPIFSCYMRIVPVCSCWAPRKNSLMYAFITWEWEWFCNLCGIASFCCGEQIVVWVNKWENARFSRHRVANCDAWPSFISMADKFKSFYPCPSMFSNPGLNIFTGDVFLLCVF